MAILSKGSLILINIYNGGNLDCIKIKRCYVIFLVLHDKFGVSTVLNTNSIFIIYIVCKVIVELILK